MSKSPRSKKRRIIKIVLLSSLSVFLILVGVLAIHIYSVTRPAPRQDLRPRALSIFNLSNPSDSVQITDYWENTKRLEGVNTVKIAPNQTSLIVEWNTQKTNPELIVGSLKTAGLNMETLSFTDAQRANGCPVIDKESWSYRLGSFFQSIFE